MRGRPGALAERVGCAAMNEPLAARPEDAWAATTSKQNG